MLVPWIPLFALVKCLCLTAEARLGHLYSGHRDAQYALYLQWTSHNAWEGRCCLLLSACCCQMTVSVSVEKVLQEAELHSDRTT